MTAKTFDVNYLLAASRMPDHFYAMMYNLTGRDEIYLNPGVSLRSFIIAHCIRREFVELTGEMLQCAEACDEFSRSTKILAGIVEKLMYISSALSERILFLPPEVGADYLVFTNSITDFSHVVKMSFDSFIMNQNPAHDHVDINSMHGRNLKSALIDLKMLIDDVAANLPPPEPAAA
jgi:hypothetical protein